MPSPLVGVNDSGQLFVFRLKKHFWHRSSPDALNLTSAELDAWRACVPLASRIVRQKNQERLQQMGRFGLLASEV